MKPRIVFVSLGIATAVLTAAVAGCGGVPRPPEVLPTVSDTFPAPYDAVWDATLRSMGVVRLVVADKAAGRIETETFTYTYFMTNIPGEAVGPILLASLDPRDVQLAQSGGGGITPTQVIWVSLFITVSRIADNTTQVQVEPRIHDSFLSGFRPGPTNNPWVDLFARIRSQLGTR